MFGFGCVVIVGIEDDVGVLYVVLVFEEDVI